MTRNMNGELMDRYGDAYNISMFWDFVVRNDEVISPSASATYALDLEKKFGGTL